MSKIEIICIDGREHARQLAKEAGVEVNKHAAEYYGALIELAADVSREKQKRIEAVADLAAKPLVGSAGDIGQIDFVDPDLFAYEPEIATYPAKPEPGLLGSH